MNEYSKQMQKVSEAEIKLYEQVAEHFRLNKETFPFEKEFEELEQAQNRLAGMLLTLR